MSCWGERSQLRPTLCQPAFWLERISHFDCYKALDQRLNVYEKRTSFPKVIPPYMDAPSLQGFHFMTAWHRWRLQPYIRTFYEATASVPDGICWSGSNHFCALDAPWGEQDLPDPGLTYPAI